MPTFMLNAWMHVLFLYDIRAFNYKKHIIMCRTMKLLKEEIVYLCELGSNNK